VLRGYFLSMEPSSNFSVSDPEVSRPPGCLAGGHLK
jgi:hypothetical protein